MTLNFSQMITVQTSRLDELLDLMTEWDRNQATADIMGYMGTRVLADRESEGRYIIVADFGVVDPGVPAAEEAERNNNRPETHAMVARVIALLDAPPVYHNFDEVYRTDPLTPFA